MQTFYLSFRSLPSSSKEITGNLDLHCFGISSQLFWDWFVRKRCKKHSVQSVVMKKIQDMTAVSAPGMGIARRTCFRALKPWF